MKSLLRRRLENTISEWGDSITDAFHFGNYTDQPDCIFEYRGKRESLSVKEKTIEISLAGEAIKVCAIVDLNGRDISNVKLDKEHWVSVFLENDEVKIHVASVNEAVLLHALIGVVFLLKDKV